MTLYEKEPIFVADSSPIAVTFLVCSGLSVMCVASALDPIRAANRIAGRQVFSWRIVSLDGEPAMTTCGLPIAVDGAFDPTAPSDIFAIIAGFGADVLTESTVLAGIRKAAASARMAGGIEAGTWILARTGLLDGHAATTHWEDFEEFATTFPEIRFRPDRYVVDGNFFTAGGASPTFDLMLHLIRTRLGIATALDVSSVFIYDEARAAGDAQPLVSLGRLDAYDPRLAGAVRMMEATVDAPLTTAAIATRQGITARTLETLFRQALGETPGAYYLRLRLNAARRLVRDSRIPLADIAARTGFSSAASFTRAFRKAFGTSPSALRRK
ncbi:GlxA family transcriptional regulator [Kaustia mangrovi]|uniref:GlxA family transcriptional regulator n=1 Tax=Kaustia mangrovi TaxID=2593653 RepID=A0A7S8HBS5_9HYPH|nr:GlxA family transcriptional regulator [Kaustia mangrovi]QPC42885.1 GlxA family transcriptional regulator [Kaustia mangrovi]